MESTAQALMSEKKRADIRRALLSSSYQRNLTPYITTVLKGSVEDIFEPHTYLQNSQHGLLRKSTEKCIYVGLTVGFILALVYTSASMSLQSLKAVVPG